MSPESIREALRKVHYPGYSRDIVSFGLVKDIRCEPGLTRVRIEIPSRDPKVPEQILHDCHAVLDPLDGAGTVEVDISVKDAPPAGGSSAPIGTPFSRMLEISMMSGSSRA